MIDFFVAVFVGRLTARQFTAFFVTVPRALAADIVALLVALAAVLVAVVFMLALDLRGSVLEALLEQVLRVVRRGLTFSVLSLSSSPSSNS